MNANYYMRMMGIPSIHVVMQTATCYMTNIPFISCNSVRMFGSLTFVPIRILKKLWPVAIVPIAASHIPLWLGAATARNTGICLQSLTPWATPISICPCYDVFPLAASFLGCTAVVSVARTDMLRIWRESGRDFLNPEGFFTRFSRALANIALQNRGLCATQ